MSPRFALIFAAPQARGHVVASRIVDGPDATPYTERPPFAYVESEMGPRNAAEKRLCERADRTDWLYIGGTLAADALAIGADITVFNGSTAPGVRLTGASLVGLTWGATLGGMYLSLPKCDPTWIRHPTVEGAVRSEWPVALSLATLASLTAPVVVCLEQGTCSPSSRTGYGANERALRVLLPMGFSFVGALVPYVLRPSTYRAAKELERLRVETDGTSSSFVSYTARF
jgi:hypothetical protein